VSSKDHIYLENEHELVIQTDADYRDTWKVAEARSGWTRAIAHAGFPKPNAWPGCAWWRAMSFAVFEPVSTGLFYIAESLQLVEGRL